MRRFVLVTAALLAAIAAMTDHAASARVRVVDRTFTCTTGFHGGARVLYIRAQAAYGQGATLDWLAGMYLSTAGQPVPTQRDYRPSLLGVNAGWPPTPPLKSGGLGFDTRRCVAMKKRIDLSRRGLVGGRASETGDDYTCVVGRKILVRVRATFRAPVEVKRISGRYLHGATGRIERAEVAVSTLAGKPLAYGEVRERGSARFFTTGGCG